LLEEISLKELVQGTQLENTVVKAPETSGVMQDDFLEEEEYFEEDSSLDLELKPCEVTNPPMVVPPPAEVGKLESHSPTDFDAASEEVH